MLRSASTSIINKVESITHPLSSHTHLRFDVAVSFSNLTISRLLLVCYLEATNMQSGLVKLCFPLCKLMCVSVNHKPRLRALYKGRAYVEPTSQQSVSRHKEHNARKENIVSGVKV